MQLCKHFCYYSTILYKIYISSLHSKFCNHPIFYNEDDVHFHSCQY